MTGLLTSGDPRAARCPRRSEADARLLSELVLFVRIHQAGRPGLLWPEHAGPDGWDRPPGDLADALALRLGRPVTALPAPALPAPARPAAEPAAAPYDLLVLQQGGSSGWQLLPPARPAAGTAARGAGPELRLRAGEVLYVPGGYAMRCRPARESRDIRLALGLPTRP
ncbi:hypothetical protein FGW37_18960 [Streptomyces rectiverticillatus]|uniref:hypothetical protein n=1 Tax=Streptomyces rectiverticillatus TaxID=173860 RepID=UPI0015C3CBB7|nr:hypothetical protein [Streptomyces rectiverticillatus]QLE73386.1 hypothetical protein FGW37_18960 [Streptomyces rectiverticillatus]